jgi:protein-tyrosine phosphatase
MIDLHCHLLPGIDDGPERLEQALELARIAIANGITHSVVTPHVHPGRYENDAPGIRQALSAFRAALRAANIPLRVGYAGEVRLSVEMIGMVEQQRLPFYGEVNGYNILLLELPHSHVPPGSEQLVSWLLNMKIRPMIAHPERNKDVMRNLDKLRPFIDAGCLFQVTAGSVAGLFGEHALRTARALLEAGHVTLLASDAHNRDFRPPRLDHGRDAAARIIGDKAAARLVYDRPRALVTSQFPDLQSDFIDANYDRHSA